MFLSLRGKGKKEGELIMNLFVSRIRPVSDPLKKKEGGKKKRGRHAVRSVPMRGRRVGRGRGERSAVELLAGSTSPAPGKKGRRKGGG